MKKEIYVFTRAFLAIIFLLTITVGNKAIGQASIAPPTQVDYQEKGEDALVKWVWNNTVPGSFNFILQQSTDGGTTFTTIATVPYTGTTDYSYLVAGLTDGTTYIWQVKVESDPAGTLESSYVQTSAYTYTAFTGTVTVGVLDKNQNSVTLNLVDNVTGEDNFVIEVAPVGSTNWVIAKTVTVSGGEMPVQITGLNPNTNYKFRAIAKKGTNSILSNEVQQKTNRDFPPKPDSFMVVKVCPEKVRVQAIYADPSLADEYTISVGAGIVAFGPMSAVVTRDIVGSPGQTLSIRIATTNETGLTNSDVVTVTLPNYSMNAPTNLSAPEDQITSTTGTVFWTPGAQDFDCLDGIIDANEVKLEFLFQDGTTGERLDVTYANANSYVIPDLQPKTWVGVTIIQRNYTHGTSAQSQQIWFRTLGPPDAPTDLAIMTQTDVLGEIENVLTFTDVANDEDGYLVEFNIDNAGWKPGATINKDLTKFVHKPLQEGVTYAYRIKGFNSYGDGPYSEVVTATVEFSKEPRSPYDLDAEMGDGSIMLTWKDDSQKESEFAIERAMDGGDFAELASVGRNVTMYTDSDVTSGTVYSYRVRARNSVGSSDPSNVVEVPYAEAVGVINVFPNPTVDVLNLKVEGESTKVTLVDQDNRTVLVKQLKINGGEATVDISNLKPGVYQMIILTDDAKKVSRKIYKY
ncbi:T9SS type A sorting domain-containing protein [Jiulongibacter sp. NS-SX5]|uniref:T9SS type A sorting domain-containing protein n=1 Tax=Jiulongibacter sp. NS-SX5 TaxID=3463854 RepID=UPI004059D0E3